MDAFLENARASEVLDYERRLGRRFPENLCGLCMYSPQIIKPEQITSLVEAHGHGIFEGIALALPFK